MKIIESIRNYISKLDCMSTFENAINANYLGGEADNFSIEEVPCKPVLKKYLNGSTKRQFQFAFCSREPYGAEIIQNIDNSGFYEDFTDEQLEKLKPVIEVEKVNNTTSISIDGVHKVDITDGYTPVKEVDYFTKEEQ